MTTHKDPTIQKILDAIGGKPEAVKQLSAALVTRDALKIREAIMSTTGITLSSAEVSAVLSTFPADDQQALAYGT